MRRAQRAQGAQAGFTVIELLIALALVMIGAAGVLAMHATSSRAGGFARHATEAAVLAEDKVEVLRTVSLATLEDGSEHVDAQGLVDDDAMYTRSWSVAWSGTLGTVTVTVAWNEGGSEPHEITYRTLRHQ